MSNGTFSELINDTLINLTHAAKPHSSFANGGKLLNSPIAYLLAQLLIIISLSRSLGYFLAKIKEPMVVAEIVGICLGPTVLGRIGGWEHALFPPESVSAMNVVANLGLVLFMFVIGLELDTNYIKARGGNAVVASMLSLVAPVAVTVPLIFILHKEDYVPNANKFTFFLFLAVVISISALPVLARILSEYKLLSTPLGAFTINCTTVDDVLSWPVLSLALALNGSANWRGVVWTILLVVGHCALVLLVLRPVLRFVVARAARQQQLSHHYLFCIMFLMLLNAWAVEVIGLSALIGAMEVGILMPRNNHVVGQLSSKIEDIVVVIFLPLFFTVSGLRTQLGQLDTLELWGLTALITLLTCSSKILGSLLPARWIGKLSWRDSIAFGCLMNTKGLVALVAINLGVSEGLITSKLFSMLVVMVLFNTLLTCPLVWLVYRVAPRKPTQSEPIAVAPFGSSGKQDGESRNKVTVMIAPQSAHVAPLLTVLGASFYPLAMGKRKLYLLRLVPAADRPSYYMGDYKKKAVSRDEVIRAAVNRAATGRITLEALCEVSHDIPSDTVQLLGQVSADLLLIDCSVDEFRRNHLHHLLERVSCSVGMVVLPQLLEHGRAPSTLNLEPLEMHHPSSSSVRSARQASRWQRCRRFVYRLLQGGLEGTPADAVQGLGADIRSLLFVHTGGLHDDAALAEVIAIARARPVEIVVLQMVLTMHVQSARRVPSADPSPLTTAAAAATGLLVPEPVQMENSSTASSGVSGSIVVDHPMLLVRNNNLLQQVYADSPVRFRQKDYVENIASGILEEIAAGDYGLVVLGFGSRFDWLQYEDQLAVPLCIVHSKGSCSIKDAPELHHPAQQPHTTV